MVLWSLVAGADAGRFIGRMFFNDCDTLDYLKLAFPLLRTPAANGNPDKIRKLLEHHDHAHISYCEPSPGFIQTSPADGSLNNTCTW